MERYNEAISTYHDLLTTVKDDFETERTTNLAAAYAAAATTNPSSVDLVSSRRG